MTYRQIAQIARCSPGAVSAEVRAMKSEKLFPSEKVVLEQEAVFFNEQEIEFKIVRF
jgi:hypothetical protein